MNVNIITRYARVCNASAFTHVSIYARQDCATVARAYVRQYNAGARERTGLNILFSLLGQGGHSLATLIPVSMIVRIMHRPPAAFNAVTLRINSEPSHCRDSNSSRKIKRERYSVIRDLSSRRPINYGHDFVSDDVEMIYQIRKLCLF